MTRAPTEPSHGRTLAGRYALGGLLGAGGMGAVYEAVHVVTARRVAVKILHRSVVQAVPTVEARFLREARASASIDHPGIVDVLDAGRDEETGDLFLVLELLEGEDLDRALVARRLSAPDVLEIITAVLDPLAAAHDSGFVHRDIKPANIFLCRAGSRTQVKLLDFGIVKAQRQADITQSGALIGTIDYMSPEQIRGERVGPEADLWGTAATLFHALLGRPPFVADTRLELMQRIGIGRVPSLGELWPGAPPALIPVLDRALSPHRSDRYPDARSLQAALQNASSSPVVSDARRERTVRVRCDLSEAAPTARAAAPAQSAVSPPTQPPRGEGTALVPAPTPRAAYPSTALATPARPSRRTVWVLLAVLGLAAWWGREWARPDPPAPSAISEVSSEVPAAEVVAPPARGRETPPTRIPEATSNLTASPTPHPLAPAPKRPVLAPKRSSPAPKRPEHHTHGRGVLDTAGSSSSAPSPTARSPEDPLRSYE